MKKGDNFIDFEAESTKGKIRLSDILNKNNFVVLYFYPKSFTSGCTRELIKFTELYEEFRKHRAEIIGVSADDIEIQKKFAEKYGAKFPIVADVEKKIIESYGVKNPRGSGAQRVTFIINKEGKIIEVLKNIDAEEHAIKSLEIIKNL
ncbi:MAG: peroxiredoxin [Candidatus Aenigmatarchaeota archaeon]